MTTRRHPLLLAVLGVSLLAAGCAANDRQSALHPAGVEAGLIHGLWDLYLWVCIAVYVVVIGFIAFAAFRRRRGESDTPVTAPPVNRELRMGAIVAGALGLTVMILFVLLVGDFVTGRRIDSQPDPNPVTVHVTGHQWWWEVRYEAATPSDVVTTANVIHVPVGRPVEFDLTSADVIHSFWVPNLHGKTDLIPRYTTHTTIRAEQPGTYWGQCAEFCGLQHANMRLLVVAEPDEDFQKWLDAQRQPAPAPETESQTRGREVFLSRSCVLCHTIGGTPAQSRVGPELTHLASRPRIAAGTLPNTRGHRAGWISDPQSIKPGVRMPPNPLAPDELQALLDYLETLK